MENSSAFRIDSAKEIFRVIIFSQLEVKGLYRYKDEFQIYPYLEMDIPKSGLQSYYPLVLEYKREKENDDIRNMGKSLFSKEDLIFTLLNSFTNNLFFKPDIVTQLGYRISDMERGENLELHWFLPITGSLFKSGLPFLEQFTNRQIEAIKSIPHIQYYYHFYDIHADDRPEFTIPETLTLVLDSYFNKIGNVSGFLKTATDYTSNAVELFKPHKTLSFLSSFTAIETMVSLEFLDAKDKTCESCKQPIYSVRQKYLAYLLKYIGDLPENKKLFDKYYKKRSDIVHRGDRFKTERYFNVENDEAAQKELELRAGVLQLSRQAITNWLLKNDN